MFRARDDQHISRRVLDIVVVRQSSVVLLVQISRTVSRHLQNIYANQVEVVFLALIAIAVEYLKLHRFRSG